MIVWAEKFNSVSLSNFFKFNFKASVELDANRPVPFRLTSNISYFLEASIEGHFTAALTAIARCFGTRSLEVWLRPILWDMFSKAAEVNTKMNILNPVKRAVDTVLNRIKRKERSEEY